MSLVERVKRWRVKQVNNGLCKYCTNKAIKNMVVCEYHAEIQRKHRRDQIKKRIEERKCRSCGVLLDEANKRECWNCSPKLRRRGVK